MKLSKVTIRNFRRLENVTIDVEERETVFVGPNNSGKTSATAIFRAFLGSREFKIHDFSVARISAFDDFGVEVDEPAGAADAEPMADAGVHQPDPTTSDAPEAATDPEATAEAPTPVPKASPTLPEISLDLWFTIDPESIAFGRVYTLLQNLSDDPKVGLRLTFGVDEPKKLRADYLKAYEKPPEGARTKTLFEYLSLEGSLADLEYIGGDQFEARTEGFQYNFGVTPKGRIYRVQSSQSLGRFSVDRTFVHTLHQRLSSKYGPPGSDYADVFSWELIEDVTSADGTTAPFRTMWMTALIGGSGDDRTLDITLIDFRILWADQASVNRAPRTQAEERLAF